MTTDEFRQQLWCDVYKLALGENKTINEAGQWAEHSVVQFDKQFPQPPKVHLVPSPPEQMVDKLTTVTKGTE